MISPRTPGGPCIGSVPSGGGSGRTGAVPSSVRPDLTVARKGAGRAARKCRGVLPVSAYDGRRSSRTRAPRERLSPLDQARRLATLATFERSRWRRRQLLREATTLVLLALAESTETPHEDGPSVLDGQLLPADPVAPPGGAPADAAKNP